MTSIYHTPADPEGYDAAMRGRSYDELDMSIPGMCAQVDEYNAEAADRDDLSHAIHAAITEPETAEDVRLLTGAGHFQRRALDDAEDVRLLTGVVPISPDGIDAAVGLPAPIVDAEKERARVEAADKALYQTECMNDNHESKCQCGEGRTDTVTFTPEQLDALGEINIGAIVESFDPVARPSHYNSDRWPCECKDFTRHMSFPAGNAFKYVWRHADKSLPVEDLDKAVEYLSWAAEDKVPVFARHGGPGSVGYYRNKAMVDEVDAAVEYAAKRSLDLPTRAAYSALSLIVRGEYSLAARLIDNVQAK
jgi:hypothetical protein